MPSNGNAPVRPAGRHPPRIYFLLGVLAGVLLVLALLVALRLARAP